MKCLALARFPEKTAGRLPINRTSAAWGTTASGLIPWATGPPGPPGPPGPLGPLPGFLLRALLMTLVIRWVGVRVLVPVVVVVAVAVVPLVVGVVPLVVAVVAACTVMVGWVVVVLIVVKIAGVNLGRVPIGLFRITEASMDVSLFSSSSVD